MKISYAITVCNEFVEIQKLIPFLLEHKRHEDEIVVLYDSKNGSKSIETLRTQVNFLDEDEFEGHFANWKNKLTDYVMVIGYFKSMLMKFQMRYL